MFWDFEVPITNFVSHDFGNGAHEHMTFMCKNFKLMKKQILHDFHCPIMGYKVYDTHKSF